MFLQLNRYFNNERFSLGILAVNGEHKMYTLEDPKQQIKIRGNTRIPAGTYHLSLYTQGRKNEQYKEKYGDKHFGMIKLDNVPGFDGILIHIGNYARDTQGCLLVGEYPMPGTERICNSFKAYFQLYEEVGKHLLAGGEAKMLIEDEGAIYKGSPWTEY